MAPAVSMRDHLPALLCAKAAYGMDLRKVLTAKQNEEGLWLRRSFTARPILSSDEPNTTRFKMERFLHAGRQTMMTVYAPIAFGPLPLLAFQRNPDGQLRLVASGVHVMVSKHDRSCGSSAVSPLSALRALDIEDAVCPVKGCAAAVWRNLMPSKRGPQQISGICRIACAGSLRSCNPDRIVLKKVVLTGYPVKVQKKKAVVRWMFHSPEDIRWFRPVDLWTKHGRRGQITVRMQPRSRIYCSCIASAL